MTYTYTYEHPPPDASEEERAAVARRNVSASLAMDPWRVDMGPTAPELHDRVVREEVERNLDAGASNGRPPS